MTKQAVASVATKLPQHNDLSAFEGVSTGLENLTSHDLLIPRLTILQQLSPQLTRGKPGFNEHAKVGDIYDVGLQERFENGIVFLPVHYAKAYIEWAPRGSGRGLIAIHKTRDVLKKAKRNDRNQPILDNGNYIAETAQWFGINVTADWRHSFLPMSSTQLKKAKLIITWAEMERLPKHDGSSFKPPLYFRSYNLTTTPESNAMGNWQGWNIERGKSLPELLPNNWEQFLKDDIIPFRESLMRGDIGGDLSDIEDAARENDEVI